ncbi:MAG: hypothetical protein AAGI23_10890, partial [Bacteroidota bacterium]
MTIHHYFKNHIHLVVILMLLLCAKGYGQENNRTTSIKFSPLSIIAGDFVTESTGLGLAVEQRMKSANTIEQELLFLKNGLKNQNLAFIPTSKVRGIKSATSFRYYFKKNENHLEGLYTTGTLQITYTKSIRDDILTVSRANASNSFLLFDLSNDSIFQRHEHGICLPESRDRQSRRAIHFGIAP